MWIEVKSEDMTRLINSYMIEYVDLRGKDLYAHLKAGSDCPLGEFTDQEEAAKAYERLQKTYVFRNVIKLDECNTIISDDNGIDEVPDEDNTIAFPTDSVNSNFPYEDTPFEEPDDDDFLSSDDSGESE